jgi:hypothetical protein
MVLEWYRYANVVLCVVAVVLMAVRFRLWLSLPASWRAACLGFGALVATTGYGTVEVILRDTPPGTRVPLVTAALVLVVYGLRRAGRDTDGNV